MIPLDGKDGGGQILRTALSLSMITGKPFHLKNIRDKRPKPGLKRQHLTCVLAAAEISDATIDGAEMNSTELIFNPGEIQAGDYHFKIGTAGSTTLLAQTLLPALWKADGPSTLRLEGGTHNPMAPPADFLQRAFLPAVAKMGFPATCELVRHGFAPAGGGEIFLTIEPAKKLSPLNLQSRGELTSKKITGTVAHIPSSIAEREAKMARRLLEWPEDTVQIVEAPESAGPGNCFALEVAREHITERVTTFGAHNVSAEKVAKAAVKAMNDYLNSPAVVGRQLADQLLLPLALVGSGQFITMNPSNHTQTNCRIIAQFLPVRFDQGTTEDGGILIEVQSP
ncbi:RNA 3'-terminal phosphate cyclase [Akkermansiaceae bacterium]|nr:RNA 3'-terminal phosphate cyclase [Akkermansiaceae bacterium]MDB4537425.1 RNA 3'-terminal phosphate cyclase [Akkermansiaceae bacterium]MDB4544546.1 RNA 3'-terminal phosphate cyclase [Akkermansiaceae bacterium]